MVVFDQRDPRFRIIVWNCAVQLICGLVRSRFLSHRAESSVSIWLTFILWFSIGLLPVIYIGDLDNVYHYFLDEVLDVTDEWIMDTYVYFLLSYCFAGVEFWWNWNYTWIFWVLWYEKVSRALKLFGVCKHLLSNGKDKGYIDLWYRFKSYWMLFCCNPKIWFSCWYDR